MAHTGDKYPFEHYKREQKLAAEKELRDNVWAMYPSHRKALYFADEAKKRNAWLFDPPNKRWYNPEEFVTETKNLQSTDDIFNRVEIRHPIDGINAGYKQITMLYGKLQELTKRVFDYYSR
ncbi:hypothetical protein [Mucilaginibacter ginsenosidivorans]|uniref:Uncharacterized protein n=1 Tax=Mucilaginibacter ginsenosidivorans TaxID=398053 RepID=A0A5B8UVM3_9SPHI|nr:hypothetical protein [Mucilaginibacter ginsenosidivorans]QEC62486.1 hypothetical protein FRZ54_07760 [Mucilaginibacter ginsenosidivorans]